MTSMHLIITDLTIVRGNQKHLKDAKCPSSKTQYCCVGTETLSVFVSKVAPDLN